MLGGAESRKVPETLDIIFRKGDGGAWTIARYSFSSTNSLQ